jgi:SAM-dependent methyltransferase
MLRHRRTERAPAAITDVCRLGLRTDSVDDVILPFVLNHLPAPADALVEAARVARPGGAVLATVFSDASRSTARDRIDEVALEEGFHPPQWYLDLRDTYAAGVGTTDLLVALAKDAGLGAIRVEEAEVETGLTEPAALVDYRLSMAQYATWLAGLDAARRRRLWRRAAEAAAPKLTSYRPIALFLTALSP